MNVNAVGLIAVAAGGTLGCWLRWGLGCTLNPLFGRLPPGTLLANLLGGFLVGVAVETLSHHGHWPPAVRLLCVTGFLGGLTTFSTYSAEVVTLMMRAEYGWAFATATANLVGSLLLTSLGIIAARWLNL